MRICIGTEGETARRAFEIGLRAPLPCPAAKDYPPGFFPGPSGRMAEALELSTAYAPNQAATDVGPDRRWGIVEIETDDLDPILLAPSTTWLSGFLAAYPGASWVETIGLPGDGAESLRAHPILFRGLWRESVEAIGRCRYDGVIPPEAVRRVSVFDPSSNEEVTLSMGEPSSSEEHHHMEANQRALTEWFFAPIDPSRMLDPVERALVARADVPLPDAYWVVQEKARDELFRWENVLAGRDGLTVLTR